MPRSIDRVCRLCMHQKELFPLFPKNKSYKSFMHAFYVTTGLKIQINDGLSQLICRDCAQTVESYIKFRSRCLATDKKLRQLKIINNKGNEDKKQGTRTGGQLHSVLTIDVAHVKNELIKAECHPDNVADVLSTENPNIENSNSDSLLFHDEPHGWPGSPSSAEASHGQAKNNIAISISSNSNHDKMENKQYIEMMEKSSDPSKQIQCKLCKKTMNTLHGFQQHVKRHMYGYKILCEYCGKPQNHWHGLLRHQRAMHGLERDDRFPCTYCDFKALDQEMLTAHERREHTKERPFVCDNCGAAFYSKRVLIQHTVLHRTDKPYQCAQCMQTFKSKQRLSGHIMKVHGLRKYEYCCSYCPKRYGASGKARNHMLKVHNIPKAQQGKVTRYCLQREA